MVAFKPTRTSTNCLPKRVCEGLLGGLTSCWNTCPSWIEWAPGSLPYLWVVALEFRRRACPCEQGPVKQAYSRVFRADWTSGYYQTWVPIGINVISWAIFYISLLLSSSGTESALATTIERLTWLERFGLRVEGSLPKCRIMRLESWEFKSRCLIAESWGEVDECWRAVTLEQIVRWGRLRYDRELGR